MNEHFHIPVMLKEVLEVLDPKPGQDFIDATVGAGGHAEAILERIAPHGRLIGIERDPGMLTIARRGLTRFGPRFVPVCALYDRINEIAADEKMGPFHGVLFDLGISSWHLEHSGRGFSFQRDELLDMRFNPEEGGPTAADILNGSSQDELARILQEYGEEPYAYGIAKAIAQKRKQKRLETTFQLVEIIARAAKKRTARIHPATKTFQALRIAVNHEYDVLERGLGVAKEVLAPGGKIAAIAFQGLEGRIIKNVLRPYHIRAPSYEEIRQNPRARSAHLYFFQNNV